MSRLTVVTCDGCDKQQNTADGSVPMGWAFVSLRAQGFVSFCRVAEIDEEHDLCPSCQDRLLHSMNVDAWPRNTPLSYIKDTTNGQ